jgi:prophage antirepressor-like protein
MDYITFMGHSFTLLQDPNTGEPWLVGRELCEFLEIKNVYKALKSLGQDEKQKVVIEEFKTKGRGGDNGARIIVNEEGANRLISKSIKPEAEIFKTWLFGDVVPAICETGSYTMKPKIEAPKAPLQQIPRAPKTYKEAVQHLLFQIEENEKLIAIDTDWYPGSAWH